MDKETNGLNLERDAGLTDSQKIRQSALKEFEKSFGVWTTTGSFKNIYTQCQFEGFVSAWELQEKKIATLEKQMQVLITLHRD